MNYERMSDLEINKLVKSKLKEIKDREFVEQSNAKGINLLNLICRENIYSIQVPDYCNSWADMGPIIQEHRIDICWPEKEIDTTGQIYKYMGDKSICINVSDSKDVLRAGAIAFLMIKEGEA